MYNLLKRIHFLSVDVGFGAVACSYAVHTASNCSVAAQWYVALWFVVISIYNVDHVLDAHWHAKHGVSERLDWHIRYKWLLMAGIALFGFASYMLVWQILSALHQIIAATALAVYMLLAHLVKTKHLWRLVFVAVVYGFGVALPGLPNTKIGALIIALLALSNLLVFVFFECDTSPKFLIQKRINTQRALIILLIALILFSILLQCWLYFVAIAPILTVYFFMIKKYTYFATAYRYRIYGDGLLIWPGIIALCYHALSIYF